MIEGGRISRLQLASVTSANKQCKVRKFLFRNFLLSVCLFAEKSEVK